MDRDVLSGLEGRLPDFFVFGLAILLVYFVLAGQYESRILPLFVILAMPLALLGVVGALMILREDNKLYTEKIGLVLLIALASKNALLIIQYARMQRAAVRDIHNAAVEAARLRFQPIIMTSFGFILGVFPLVTASSTGAASERSIGIAVFYGMIASTGFAVVFVPSFYVLLQRFEDRRKRRRLLGLKSAPLPLRRRTSIAGLDRPMCSPSASVAADHIRSTPQSRTGKHRYRPPAPAWRRWAPIAGLPDTGPKGLLANPARLPVSSCRCAPPPSTP
jgi:predicted RND superfamily exporter protein